MLTSLLQCGPPGWLLVVTHAMLRQQQQRPPAVQQQVMVEVLLLLLMVLRLSEPLHWHLLQQLAALLAVLGPRVGQGLHCMLQRLLLWWRQHCCVLQLVGEGVTRHHHLRLGLVLVLVLQV